MARSGSRRTEKSFKNVERHLLVRQMGVSAGLLLTFAVTVILVFYHQEHRALQGRLEVLTLAISESVEDERATPGFDDSSFLGPTSPNPADRRIQWLDLSGRILADRGHLPFSDEEPLKVGITLREKPVPALVETLLCYNDEVPKRPYGFTRVAVSLESLDATMRQLLWDLGAGLGVALVLAAICSRYLALQALEPLWTAYQQISRFSADASHELRNPLAAVLCNVELLREQGGCVEETELQESLDRIHDAAAQMTNLVESLLTLARASDLGLGPTAQVSLAVIVETVLVSLGPEARLRGVELQSRLEDISVLGDGFLLASLARNLVDNAVRHTARGGRVEVHLSKQSPSTVLEIVDTGAGIAEAELPFVFDRFWRASKARTPGTGSGLGLSVVRAIAEAHGAKVEVESEIHRGSIFRVRFPSL